MNFLTLDLELTMKEDGAISPEIVSVGVALYSNFGIVCALNQFVRPKNRANVGPNLEKLTRITWEDLKSAPPLIGAFNILSKKFPFKQFPTFCWGHDGEFIQNLEREGRINSFFKHSPVNYATVYNVLRRRSNPISLENALKDNGLDIKGTLHDSMYDAINLGELIEKMSQDIGKANLNN
jgi:inhibitor of KinA sporulation pathway (predicted exonuclease)